MPTLFRFLFVLAVLAGLAFAAMFALATLVEPQPREMSVTIPVSCGRGLSSEKIAWPPRTNSSRTRATRKTS